MQFDFEKVMAENSDQELIRIAGIDRNEFQPAAVLAAEAELKKRNLSMEFIEKINEKINLEKKYKDEKSNEPLHIGFKIMAMLLPGVLMMIFAATYKSMGYDRKANQLATFTFYGVGLYIAITIFSIVV